MDLLRSSGAAPSRYAGIPISIKDLFDVSGQVTRAGSTALKDRPAATRDAACVARLRRAGFVLVGRTNMSEFAFSGIGDESSLWNTTQSLGAHRSTGARRILLRSRDLRDRSHGPCGAGN